VSGCIINSMKIDRALENQDYSLAQSILDDIPTNFNLRARQDQEWMDYQVCYQLLIELEQNNADSLTGAQIDNLMVIAAKHSNSAAGLAWQILGQYDATYVLEGMIAPGSNTKSLARNGKEEITNPFEDLQYIHVFPNPASDIAVLEFVGYETLLTLKIIDAKGELVFTQTIDGKALQQTLKLGEYASGIYTVIVSDQSGILLNQQLVIKH